MGAGDTVLIRERVEHGQCAVAPGARKLSFAYRLMENQTVYNRDAQQQARDALVIQDGGRLLELFQASRQSNQEADALIAALRPFLREERQKKLDQAIQLAGLSRAARQAYRLWKEGELHL